MSVGRTHTYIYPDKLLSAKELLDGTKRFWIKIEKS